MSKKKLINVVLLFLIFGIFTLLVQKVDVMPIAPDKSDVGFASINGLVKGYLPFNQGFYLLSEYLGYLALLAIGVLALCGLDQLIKRKNLLSVDNTILMAGVVFALTLFFYLLFGSVINVNVRPCFVEAKLEASYPSSHALMAIVVYLIMSDIFNRYNQTALSKVCLFVMTATVVSRLLSGVHWITDYVGAVLLGLALYSLYKALVSIKDN